MVSDTRDSALLIKIIGDDAAVDIVTTMKSGRRRRVDGPNSSGLGRSYRSIFRIPVRWRQHRGPDKV